MSVQVVEDVPAVFSFFDRLAAQSARVRGAVVLASWILSFALDAAAPRELSILGIYLVPVALTSWLCADPLAWIVLTFAGFGACVIEAANGIGYGSSVLLAVAVIFRAAFFAVVGIAGHDVKRAHRVLEQRSERDTLTGLLNRRGFRKAATLEIERARRHHRPLCVAYLDLDDFKRVNDAFGHGMGDRLLAIVGRTLGGGRRLDVAARVGGDEFVVLMPETNEEGARAAIERLRRKFASAVEREGIHASFTTGIAAFERPPKRLEALLEEADRLLASGKNEKGSVRVKHADPERGVASRKLHVGNV